MKIPHEHIPYTYQESKRVFENNLPIKEAAENINKNCDITYNSCADYAHYFKYLMTGNQSCRILSSYTQEYYLEHIYKDYGKEQLEKSLKNFYSLIEMFEQQGNPNKKSMRAIYEKYSKLV